ncbi:MAG: hypothetical protein HKN42_14740 [Granulosicoccus sp.]|nr:hypothetical protein [Granulosicoccus sp.]
MPITLPVRRVRRSKLGASVLLALAGSLAGSLVVSAGNPQAAVSAPITSVIRHLCH